LHQQSIKCKFGNLCIFFPECIYHKNQLMCKLKNLSFLLLLFFSVTAKAQNDFSAKTWFYIDTSLYSKTNLVELSTTVDKLKTKAIAAQKYFYVARCFNYNMRITDLKTEDSLYFKNSSFIDEMLLQPQQPKQLQFALHLMQASRLMIFTKRYNRFQRQRYERKDIPVNYATLSNSALDSIAYTHFEQAKAIAKEIADTNIDEALWLSADPLQFLYQPGLFDIAIAEQINTVKTRYFYETPLNKRFNNWLILSADGFITKLDSVNDAPNTKFKDLQLYHEWLQYYQSNRNNYYFIESVARKYIYELVKQQLHKDVEKIYETYLLQNERSPYTIVKAYSVYQLCLLWNSQATQYFPSNQSTYDYTSSSYKYNTAYDTAYRYHAVKALQLFNANKALLDSFAYLKNILFSMEEKIKKTDLTLSVQSNNLPNEPFLAELKFKNTDTLFYKIVRLPTRYTSKFRKWNEIMDNLLQQTEIRSTFVILPKLSDYNYHNVFLDMKALPAGSYTVIFSSRPVTDTTVYRRKLYFDVTNIALLNNDKRIYVLDRKAGKPLTGAIVKATYKKTIETGTVTTYEEHSQNYMVNKQGFIEIKDSRYSDITASFAGDTINQQANFSGYDKPDDVYSKDEDDDLVDFYADNAGTYIYTDRSIYRPGQTVFYKAIFLTKNKNTGEPMVMNKKNLKGKLFGNLYKKLLKEEEPFLFINNPFGETMDSIKIAPGEFGSLYGSFKIPKTAATGDWEIAPDYIDAKEGTGTFKVEEYKRPSYEINLEKPKKELQLADSFSVKVKVRSFAGATLNNVKIKYEVSRTGDFENYDPVSEDMVMKSGEETIMDTTGFTDNNGELNILIHDTAVLNKTFKQKEDWQLHYQITATAIDATGESYEKKEYVYLAAKPVSIRLAMDATYNRSDLKAIPVTTTDKNAGTVNKKVNIKIFRIIKQQTLFNDRKYTKADVWLYDSTVLQNEFPYDNLLKEEHKETEELVYEKLINTGDKEKLLLDVDILSAGNYKIEASCKEGEKITGELVKNFSVFDVQANALPQPAWAFTEKEYHDATRGGTVQYYYGNTFGETYSIFHVVYFAGKKKLETKYFYDEQTAAKGLQKYTLQIPNNATDQVKLTQLYILNNQLFSNTETFKIAAPPTSEPEIIIEKYRKQLIPGSKETFSVAIKTKNENTAAELMTTMYDASLDKLEEHRWEKPRDLKESGYIRLDWTDRINFISTNYEDQDYYRDGLMNNFFGRKDNAAPLWWVNPLDYADADVMGDWKNIPHRVNNFRPDEKPRFAFTSSKLRAVSFSANYNMDYDKAEDVLKIMPGLTLGSSQGLDEVVVIGYGSERNMLAGKVAGVNVQIRGVSSADLLAYKQPLIVLDGVVYTGELSAIDAKTITAGIVLKGADAIAIYGATAANGVLILSTKGDIILPKEPEPVITPRKNFNETAFFFPAIYADKNGYYTFSFTMPESVTEWNWKLLAHTRNAVFTYAERKLHTQLPLMVQPNMPRLLYQGDKIILQSRITNLDTVNAIGKIVCKIEDAVTGNDITAQLVNTAQNNFTVIAKQNIAVAFTLTIPVTQLNPVKVSITVRSQNFADGEEHIIPILSPKVFVRDNAPFYLSAQHTTVSLVPLPADAAIFGTGLSIQPKPQAALLNSLPALANYPYGCAEQTFNKLLAYTTAYKLIRNDTATQRSFTAAKDFVEKENTVIEKLPDELNQEAMPWLNLTNEKAMQQLQLFKILDTAQSQVAIEALVKRLEKLQNEDGGISWFDGGKSSPYISSYLLKGLGKLAMDEQLLPSNIFNDYTYRGFVDKLVQYCDNNFLRFSTEKEWYTGLQYAYSRSYMLTNHPLQDSIQQAIKKMLAAEWKTTTKKSLYNQALLIITSFKYATGEKDSLYTNAAAQLQSLEQLAINDEQNGLRWKQLADNDDLTNSAEETIALLAEAFASYKTPNAVNKGIIKWLLTAKNEHSWSSTKATAAAINLLAAENNTVSGETQTVQMSVDKTQLAVSNDLLNGKIFNYAAATSLPSSVTLQKEGNAATAGNLYRYYFTAAENVPRSNNDIQLSKQLYQWNNATNSWETLPANNTIKIADKIKVVLTVQCSRPLQYVFINDARAAAFEPASNSSGYEYNDGISYYQSVRDAGMHFFIDFIPSGKHEIVYEMKAAQEGSFTSGIGVLQRMYRPEVTAYSNGIKIVCEK